MSKHFTSVVPSLNGNESGNESVWGTVKSATGATTKSLTNSTAGIIQNTGEIGNAASSAALNTVQTADNLASSVNSVTARAANSLETYAEEKKLQNSQKLQALQITNLEKIEALKQEELNEIEQRKQEIQKEALERQQSLELEKQQILQKNESAMQNFKNQAFLQQKKLDDDTKIQQLAAEYGCQDKECTITGYKTLTMRNQGYFYKIIGINIPNGTNKIFPVIFNRDDKNPSQNGYYVKNGSSIYLLSIQEQPEMVKTFLPGRHNVKTLAKGVLRLIDYIPLFFQNNTSSISYSPDINDNQYYDLITKDVYFSLPKKGGRKMTKRKRPKKSKKVFKTVRKNKRRGASSRRKCHN